MTAQDGPNGRLSSSITFFSFWLIKTWCTSNQISDHSVRIGEFSWHNFISKICGPIIKGKHLWICTKFMHLHIPISLFKNQNWQCLANKYKIDVEVRSEKWVTFFTLFTWSYHLRQKRKLPAHNGLESTLKKISYLLLILRSCIYGIVKLEQHMSVFIDFLEIFRE